MTEYTLKEIIDFYDNGVISASVLVKWLSEWDYIEQDTNSSPWECDAQYVEGSWDDVENAVYDGIIPDSLYGELIDCLYGDDHED